MSTKINLEFPFSEDFKAGYLNVNKEPRRVVLLVKKDNSKTSISYARYLVSCKEKRYLSKEEHVDHIDNNKLNDNISNLQILSQKENNRKNREKIFISLICPICGKTFSKERRQLSHKIKMGKVPTCSRICGGKKSHIR
jgi:hypothetical protein